jgi:sugar lactone lactonase YvrE
VTYTPGTILENIAIAPSGNIFATDVANGTIYQVTPAGSSHVFAQVNDGLAGVALNTDNRLYAAGLTTLYGFAADGTASTLVNIPGAQELNGLTLIAPNKFLVADDAADTIWLVDTASGHTEAWLTGPLLAPSPGGLPFGPNGIKVYQGSVYISNTGAGTLLRVPILPGGAAGAPEILKSSLVIDDFAFGSDGSIFAAAQFGQIIRLYPDGSQTMIPTGTLGDAAVAFGRTPADVNTLYVVNNGGAFLGLPDGPDAGSIVRLNTNVSGALPGTQVVPEPSTVALCILGLACILLRKRNSIARHCGHDG